MGAGCMLGGRRAVGQQATLMEAVHNGHVVLRVNIVLWMLRRTIWKARFCRLPTRAFAVTLQSTRSYRRASCHDMLHHCSVAVPNGCLSSSRATSHHHGACYVSQPCVHAADGLPFGPPRLCSLTGCTIAP